MLLETIPLDVAKHLTDPADQAELIAEAFASGDADVSARPSTSWPARAG